jgi:hypothetical protein
MASIANGGINWDRAAMTIRQFANEIDTLCADRASTEHRDATPAKRTKADECREVIETFASPSFGHLVADSQQRKLA